VAVGQLEGVEQGHVVVVADHRGVGVDLPPARASTYEPVGIALDDRIGYARQLDGLRVAVPAQRRDGLGVLAEDAQQRAVEAFHPSQLRAADQDPHGPVIGVRPVGLLLGVAQGRPAPRR
jgi:hypothetical protein